MGWNGVVSAGAAISRLSRQPVRVIGPGNGRGNFPKADDHRQGRADRTALPIVKDRNTSPAARKIKRAWRVFRVGVNTYLRSG